jgi:hypothetical protein
MHRKRKTVGREKFSGGHSLEQSPNELRKLKTVMSFDPKNLKIIEK